MALIVPIIVAVLSLLIIMKSAGYAISSVSNFARKTGISEYVIGFLIVALGTSLPEFCCAIFSSLEKQGLLVLGDVIGANIIDVTIVLGLTAVVGKKIAIEAKGMNSTILMVIGIVTLPLILGFDGTLSRIDGGILIGTFITYLVIMMRKEGKAGKLKKNVVLKEVLVDIIVFGGTLSALLLAARFFILSTLSIAHGLNVPVLLMGLVFVAVGTTVPELTVELRSVLKGHSGIAFGDIFGSAVANVSAVLGIAALIHPIILDISRFIASIVFMIFAVSLGSLLMRKSVITWRHGTMMLGIYVVFLLMQWLV